MPKNALEDSDVELIREARKGVSTSLLWHFLQGIDSSKSEFENLLPYSLKTFSRKEVLDEAMGEHILNIIKVFKKGEEFFEDISAFKKWLDNIILFLGDQPKTFLKTSTGCQIVIDEPGRAEHGVMS